MFFIPYQLNRLCKFTSFSSFTELNCPKLATSERLTFSSNTESHYVYGDIVTYNCDSNYRLIGASMTYCTANGTWSKSTPLCKGEY